MNENKNQHELNVCLDECLLYIHSFLKGRKTVVKTLQIGLADGKLANTIVGATQKPHIVVDPRQEMQQFAGIKFLKAEDNWNLIDYRDDNSYAVLPKLLEGNILPEFIVIDGDLRFDAMLTDFFSVDLILKKNCFVLIRKNELESTKLVHQFIQTNRQEYTIVKELNQYILYQKEARDIRKMDFFEPFYL